MTPELLDAVMTHAQAEAHREACGLFVLPFDGCEARYQPCRNIAQGEDEFQIDYRDWMLAEDSGTVLGVVHSHPNGMAVPSEADRAACDESGIPWWVVNSDREWTRITPKGFHLEGRQFAWGIQDCFSLVSDLIGPVADTLREPRFWERGQDPYREGYLERGFRAVEGMLQAGDVLLFSILAPGCWNHAGVYQGEGRFIHHLPNRLSRSEALTESYQRRMVAVLRRFA